MIDLKLSKADKKLFYTIMFPVLLETVIMRLFHIADSVMLGQMTDSTVAVAAVGLCASPIHLIMSVTASLFIGITSTIAWFHGADEKEKIRNIAWQSFIIAIFVAIILSLFSIVFAENIMAFICGENETLPIATSYYKINAYGFFFQIMTAAITAAFRGIGITKIALVYNLIGGVFNVFLNYLLIYGAFGFPEMRADGAALATTISKIISFVIALCILLFKDTLIKYKKGTSFKFDTAIKTRLLPIGLTSAGEQIILQTGAIFSAKTVAFLPTPQIASRQIVTNFSNFAWATGSACQAASTTLFGRSLGSNNTEKAKKYLSLCVKWALGFAFCEMILFCFFGNSLAAVFTNDTSLYHTISILFIISAASLPFINTHLTVSGALRSSGDSVAPLIASFLSLWIFRVLLGYLAIVVFKMGIYQYEICVSSDQIVRCIIICIFYLTGHWKKFLLKVKEK